MRTRERVATAPRTETLNVEGLPFVVTPRSKAAKFEQAVGRLMSEINLGAASAEREGWV